MFRAMIPRPIRRAILALLAASAVGAQQATPPSTERPALAWTSLFTFYADNTEFFTPYRLGETILGAQATGALSIRPRDDVELLVGAFGDYRYGSPHFLDQIKPVLSLRWRARSQSREAVGVLGTLITERRHGFLEPIEVTTLELTRPVEYGGQWIERRRWMRADLFVNWQHLLSSTQREVFDYGGVLALTPARWLAIEGQLHGVHHGGQQYSGAEPVENNVVTALGARLVDTLPLLGRSELALFRLQGRGNIDPAAPDGEPRHGWGTYLRGGITPLRWVELFGIYWRARDFLSAEGDRNYSSEGFTYARYYRSPRTYIELGIARRVPIERGIALDTELRFHRMDHQPSTDPIFGKTWEYSYRIVARVPVGGRIGR
jgi:hypothetical protein